MVAHFTNSPKKTNILKKLLEEDGIQIPLGMLKFSTTRWSGAFRVLCRLLRLKKYLDKYFLDQNVDKDISLQTSDWKKILQIAGLLESFTIITNFLQYKCKSIAAAKFTFLSFLQRAISDAKSSEIEFEGENKEEFETKITSSLAKKILKRLDENFKKAFGSFLKYFTSDRIILNEETNAHLAAL